MKSQNDTKTDETIKKVQEKVAHAKEVYKEKVRPVLQEKGKEAREKLKEGKKSFDDNIAPKIKEQSQLSREAAKGFNPFKGLKSNFKQELFTNGISLLIAFSISKLLSHFFVVKSFHSFFHHSEHQMQVSEGTLTVISLSVEFVVGLLVFTFIEHFIENYLAIKEQKSTQIESI